MQNLKKIFGVIVELFFSAERGVSLSEIARMQAEYKQPNDAFWARVSEATKGMFTRELSFVGPGDSAPKVFAGETVTPDELRGYRDVGYRSAEIANLMHALKVWKRLQEQLQRMDLRSFVADSLPTPPDTPTPAASGTTGSTERFMELQNVDDMIAQLHPAVLATFDLAFFRRANELNSRAAVLGKLLSEEGSFFRELIKAVPQGEERPVQSGLIVFTWKRSYDESAVAELTNLREELRQEYDGLQRELNGFKKQIKDAVREFNLNAERQYQAAYGTYRVAAEQYALEVERIRSAAETLRQQALQELAALRVRTE